MFIAVEDYHPADVDVLSLEKGEIVEVLDASTDGIWLIKKKSSAAEIGFVSSQYLRKFDSVDQA